MPTFPKGLHGVYDPVRARLLEITDWENACVLVGDVVDVIVEKGMLPFGIMLLGMVM